MAKAAVAAKLLRAVVVRYEAKSKESLVLSPPCSLHIPLLSGASRALFLVGELSLSSGIGLVPIEDGSAAEGTGGSTSKVTRS